MDAVRYGGGLCKSMSDIQDRLEEVSQRIDRACESAGLPRAAVRLLAVSKTFGPEAVLDALAAGQQDFGENYVQEGVEKILAVAQQLEHLASQPPSSTRPRPCWHFIGPLQSNKTRDVAEQFDWVHSIDRLKIAQRLLDQRPAHLGPLQVCLQVNTSGEQSKSGVSPAAALQLAVELAELIQAHPRSDQAMVLRGLMTIPEPSPQDRVIQERFSALVALRDDIAQALRERGLVQPLDVLSMGMSADLELAIAASTAKTTTWVRVGTAIFGARPRREA
jgi:pyridoxal phosphate enzyme (YggS family)